MIDKVIIAEDHESANLSVQKTVEEMRIKQVDYVFYCDEALKKITLAKDKGEPYDLLITDLQFDADDNKQQIKDGLELISHVREHHPEIRVLVFSAEQRAATIDNLYEHYKIDGFVRKARHDARELKTALELLSRGERYYPRSLNQYIKQSNTFEFTEFDVNVIRLLSQGYQQNEIPPYLKQNDIRPSSLSSVEKRLSQIREALGYSKNEQLVLFCKEVGIL